ncbi:hypothetical protein A374_07016 [Fictibacillus macauensis ZFHKF-1]|uniref:Uncharacterized protein n=1 Tax=Fictibacillus macauensis ZFHKF-1 TaxID=1196324 RepID=I8J2S8_9BACL|nr:hypothetical protein [Fictibacillus macauensis]EIT86051.1 hypothetical protein A374_07016 [Fictibacillus macauensis ZFHKF-1]
MKPLTRFLFSQEHSVRLLYTEDDYKRETLDGLHKAQQKVSAFFHQKKPIELTVYLVSHRQAFMRTVTNILKKTPSPTLFAQAQGVELVLLSPAAYFPSYDDQGYQELMCSEMIAMYSAMHRETELPNWLKKGLAVYLVCDERVHRIDKKNHLTIRDIEQSFKSDRIWSALLVRFIEEEYGEEALYDLATGKVANLFELLGKNGEANWQRWLTSTFQSPALS